MKIIQFNDKLRAKVNIKECYIHNFQTTSDILMDEHLRSLPHYALGTNGICTNCGNNVPEFLIPYNTINKPAHILCDDCKNRFNEALETLQDTKLFNSCFHKEKQI